MKIFTKIFGLFLLSILFVACTEEGGDNNNQDEGANISEKTEKLNNTVDSLRNALNTYQESEEELQKKYADLEMQLQEKSKGNANEGEVQVVYKTKVEYKEDEATIKELEAKKNKVKSQLNEIERLKESLTEAENELDNVNEEVVSLKLENKNLLTTEQANSMVSDIIKTQIYITDIEVQLYKAKDEVELVQTSFTVNENRFASTGEKEVYLCIYDNSNNEVLSNNSGDSFKSFDGKNIVYSAKDKFDYQSEKLRMSMVWEKEKLTLEPGSYTTEFYIGNTLSGVGTFDIK